MIKFFRYIRQSLLSENKFSKYLLYAVGEIILVVIGILIALQINTENQNKQDRAFELKILNDIRNDLVEDIEYIQWVTAYINFSDYAAQQLLNADETSKDSLNTIYFDPFIMGNDIILETRKGAYEALKSSGFEKVSNDSLRAGLVSLYDFNQAWVENGMERNRMMYTRITDQLLKEILVTEKKLDQFGNQILSTSVRKSLSTEDPSFLRLLSIVQKKNQSNLGWITGLNYKSYSVLDLLNKELKEYYEPIEVGPSAIQTVGLLGSATEGGWDTDINMKDVGQDGIYTLETTLADGEVKFRANDSWDINWGSIHESMSLLVGIGAQDGQNIKIEAGRYRISLDINSGFYTFLNLE